MILTLFQESTWSEGSAGTFMNIAELPKEIISSSSMNQVIPLKKLEESSSMDCWSKKTPPLRRGTVAHLGRAQYTETTHLFGDLFHFLKTQIPNEWLRLKKKKGQRGSNETHQLFVRK